jgi:hypothetical protein
MGFTAKIYGTPFESPFVDLVIIADEIYFRVPLIIKISLIIGLFYILKKIHT